MKSKYIIKSNLEFKSFFVKRKIIHSRFFVFYLKNNNKCEHVRFGITVNKKHFKKSVTRNKIKRQIKSTLHLIHLNCAKKNDVLIVVKPGYEIESYEKTKNDLIFSLKKIEVL